MPNDFLIIVPTRSRPDNLSNLVYSWKATTAGCTDMIVALDDDDPIEYPPIDGVIYSIDTRIRMAPTLNRLAIKMARFYKYTMFMGDDFLFRTQGWDEQMRSLLQQNSVGFVYGNDLHQGEALPTEVAMTNNIIDTLGYMVPPTFMHMFADNLWRDWGLAIESLFYLENIIIEHMHPDCGKSDTDDLYRESMALMGADGIAYNEYHSSGRFAADVQKLIELKESYNV